MTAAMAPLLREEARKRQEAIRLQPGHKIGDNVLNNWSGPTLGGNIRDIAAKDGTKQLEVETPQAVSKSASRDVTGFEDIAAGRFSCESDASEPGPGTVSIEAAARAASQILEKEPGASWEPIIEFAARIRVEVGLELLDSLVAGGWRAARTPEKWLKVKLAHDARCRRIREARRVRLTVGLNG